MLASLVRLGAIAVLVGACSDDPAGFDHLMFRDVSSAPGRVSLRPREMLLERGIAVKARVTAIDRDGDPMDLLSLETSDSGIFEVDPGPELGEFVFYGVEEGEAELDVFSRNRFEASLPVAVTVSGPDTE